MKDALRRGRGLGSEAGWFWKGKGIVFGAIMRGGLISLIAVEQTRYIPGFLNSLIEHYPNDHLVRSGFRFEVVLSR